MKIYDYSVYKGWLNVAADAEATDQLNHAYRLSEIQTIGYSRLQVTLKLRGWDYLVHLDIPEADHMTDDGAGWRAWEIWDAVLNAEEVNA